jgi:Fe-S cluster assembly protein SufD
MSDVSLTEDAYHSVRQQGLQRLMKFGFPDLRTEAWKYTSLRLIEKRDIGDGQGQTASLPKWPINGTVLHFDHGKLLGGTDGLPSGLVLSPMAADQLEAKKFDDLYGEQAGAFAWLNLARFSEAWHLSVEGSHELVIAITTSPEFNGEIFPRLKIDLEPHASLVLIEDQKDEGQGLVNVVTEIAVGEGACLSHIIKRDNRESAWVQRTDVRVSKDGDYRVMAFDQGGRLIRHDLTIRLDHSGAQGQIDGLALLDGNEHVDWHTEMIHQTGHTNSRESFRMLADGSSVGVFNGRIHIHENADDSHSDLNTANLLLSEAARVNIKPELEIYSEEVTASHGATIGQLDDRALFYMQSRGLSESDARALLKYGFAAEPIQSLTIESVRDWLLDELKQVL